MDDFQLGEGIARLKEWLKTASAERRSGLLSWLMKALENPNSVDYHPIDAPDVDQRVSAIQTSAMALTEANPIRLDWVVDWAMRRIHIVDLDRGLSRSGPPVQPAP